MKKALIAVAALMTTLAAQAADGQIILGNFSTSVGLNSRITLSPGGGNADAKYSVQLYRVTGGSESPLGPAITLRSGTGAGTFANTTITIPNFGDANGPATFRVKGFETGKTFDTSVEKGVSPDFTATVNVAPTPPTLTTTFPAFAIVVPEPSTIALAALGGAALLLRRRK